MRVLTVVEHLGPGGTQRVAQVMAIGLQHRGHDSSVLAHKKGGPRERYLVEENIPVFVGHEDETLFLEALQEAAEWQPDLIHVHREGLSEPRTALIVSHIRQASRHRIPVVETNVFGRPDYSPDRNLIDIHLHLTRWALWKWQRLTRSMAPAPIGVFVPNPVATSSFYPAGPEEMAEARVRLGIPTDAVLCGHVGQPDPHRWSPQMIDAFAQAARQRNDLWLLTIGLSQQGLAYTESLPPDIRKRIIHLPFVASDAQLRAFYSVMDMFIHASRLGETFGLVFAESLLCGTPVIAMSRPSRGNGMLEVVGHNRGGLIVNDFPSMVRAILKLAADSNLRASLAQNGAAYIRAHYDVEVVLDLLLNVYSHALRNPTRESLALALESDPDLVTGVPDEEVEQLLSHTMGRIPLRERFLMNLVLTPILFRLWHTRRMARYAHTD